MENLKKEIEQLKQEKNAVLLAHYYVDDAVQEIADYVGDSYYLAKVALKESKDVICFAGVNFMGESAKILNPDRTVIMPDQKADCPMAHMVDVEKIEEMRKKYDDLAVVCYINSTAEIKAHSDVCVTSSNALKVVTALPQKNIFFVPDENLGRYIGSKLPEKNFIYNDGFCHVHRSITAENVKKAKEYIKNGDIFQVVLSQRFEVETDVDPFDVYRCLRTLNPSPYLYFFDFIDYQVVGASPEKLVSVLNGIVATKPIAGTVPRGKTKEEDDMLVRQLVNDPKERAEHTMLVDLGRNDVGKVSKFGTVEVKNFMTVEKYSKVTHLVSDVQGELRDDENPINALMSVLPAGTLSGAPKVRAMEIIDELENKKRGVYGGTVGYLGFDGNIDTCIAIRTVVFKDGKGYVQAGAGIVNDSVPEKEFMETKNKALAVVNAVKEAARL